MDRCCEFDVVTGGFGYTGKYVTRRLLELDRRVRTLTKRPQSQSPFGQSVRAFPFNFECSEKLIETLRDATTLYNTYWVRFPRGRVTFESAVENTKTLIKSAEEAGVRRIVHVSITNANADSPLPYFHGKGLLEKTVMESKLSYAIIRPTVIFGREDILINNIGWLLRNMPMFGIPGSGTYRLQPIFVEDLADIMVRAGQDTDNMVIDAVGPEIFTFEEMVRLIAEKIQSRARIVRLNPRLVLFAAKLVGWVTKDVVLTKTELDGLIANLLVSPDKPTGWKKFSDWLTGYSNKLGTNYASELQCHY